MQEIQLYIEGQRVEMFKDESVSITQTIQNVKDIAKVFTDFSKSFTVPATPTNNKIFKHFYNFDIVNGYDARLKKSATIELNNLPFKQGKIKLEGVDLKDEKPNAYRVIFFGNTVTLKDLVGEDKLQSLNLLTSLNEDYNSESVRLALQRDPEVEDVIVPLITHTERLYYDTSTNIENTGNLNYTSGNVKGVRFNQLKYAIRLHKIIEAIEDKYNITFSEDFFTESNPHFYNLFMWLHRKKGDVENLSGEAQSVVDGFTVEPIDFNTQSKVVTNSTIGLFGLNTNYFSFALSLTTSSTVEYTYSVLKDGVEIFRKTTTGSSAVDLLNGNIVGEYSIYIESDVSFSFSDIKYFVGYANQRDGVSYNKSYSTGFFNFANTFSFDITQQMPKMKVIDFLSGLFRMFNLTAFVEDDIVVVKTLDSFYNEGVSYDITDYIDTSKSSVNSALPYKEINFEHEDTKSFLAANHEQIVGKIWGRTEYTQEVNNNIIDGSIYNVKTPFAQAKYERLLDVNGGDSTTIQVGYFVDDNQEAYIGKPLLFYPIKVSGTPISFINNGLSIDSISNYIIPSNSVALDSDVSKENMNFFNEVNEYTFDESFTETLFQKYYRNYITDIFDPTNRITKLSAYLPLRILLNFSLADRFVVRGHYYKINSISTNLKTGKSDIELLNDDGKNITLNDTPTPPSNTLQLIQLFKVPDLNDSIGDFNLIIDSETTTGVGQVSAQNMLVDFFNGNAPTPIGNPVTSTLTGLKLGANIFQLTLLPQTIDNSKYWYITITVDGVESNFKPFTDSDTPFIIN